jgi:hypothetical protein
MRVIDFWLSPYQWLDAVFVGLNPLTQDIDC